MCGRAQHTRPNIATLHECLRQPTVPARGAYREARAQAAPLVEESQARAEKWAACPLRLPLQGPRYYIAGPPAMVTAMREMLHQADVSDEDVRSEAFAGY